MNKLSCSSLILALLLPLSAAAAGSQAQSGGLAKVRQHAVSPDSYHVFVDLPTGYMFVKTPFGWKFRGQLAADRFSQLPVGTYVSLLPNAQVSAPELAASQYAGKLQISQR